MEQKNVFELSHVVLWLKGWYDHTEDKWKDLATMLNLDGHPGYKSKEDITRCLVYYYNEWCNYVNTNFPHEQRKDIYGLYIVCVPTTKGEHDFYETIVEGICQEWKFCKHMTIPRPIYTPELLPHKYNKGSRVDDWYKEAEENNITDPVALSEFFNKKIQQMEMWKNEITIIE